MYIDVRTAGQLKMHFLEIWSLSRDHPCHVNVVLFCLDHVVPPGLFFLFIEFDQNMQVSIREDVWFDVAFKAKTWGTFSEMKRQEVAEVEVQEVQGGGREEKRRDRDGTTG